jgi:hypothetical protein
MAQVASAAAEQLARRVLRIERYRANGQPPKG